MNGGYQEDLTLKEEVSNEFDIFMSRKVPMSNFAILVILNIILGVCLIYSYQAKEYETNQYISEQVSMQISQASESYEFDVQIIEQTQVEKVNEQPQTSSKNEQSQTSSENEQTQTSSQNQQEQLTDLQDEYVYVTASGEKMHKETCSYLTSSKIKILKREALEKGYSYCKRCFPD